MLTKTEKLLCVFMLALAVAFVATAKGQGQGISEATAATLKPPSPAKPAVSDKVARLVSDNAAFKEGFSAGAASANLGKSPVKLTPAQETRLGAIEKDMAECKRLAAELVAKTKQPTLAPAKASTCAKCGPNCRCAPGQCNCRWPGECLGVPDSRVERSVVKSAQPATTTTVWRPATSTVRYYYAPRTRYYYPQYYDAGWYGGGCSTCVNGVCY